MSAVGANVGVLLSVFVVVVLGVEVVVDVIDVYFRALFSVSVVSPASSSSISCSPFVNLNESI